MKPPNAQTQTSDRSRLEIITPERAAKILATANIKNRIIRQAHVLAYSRDMAAGRWVADGCPALTFSKDGRLLNGQHRLLACVEAGVPFQSWVLYDADESIHFAIDKGIKRTVGDELGWNGETDVNNLSSTLSLLWKYENGSLMNPRLTATTSEIIEFLNDKPYVREATALARPLARQLGVPVAAFATTLFLLNSHGDDLVELFCTKLSSGAELVEGDPLLALRKYALNVAAVKKNRPRREEWLAVIIKAANAWLLGRSVNRLRWRRYGPAAEPFPQLISPDEL